jgi:hypothetical protein
MENLTLTLFDQLALQEQDALSKTFESRHFVFSQTNNLLIDTLVMLLSKGWKTHSAIWNPCLFLNTVSYDLSFYIYDLAYEKNDWKRRLIARNLATLLFESAEDLPTVFGRKFNDALNVLNVSSTLLADFREKLGNVSEFWNNHRIQLKEIRLICGAHRDHNAILLNQTIDNLDLLEILRLGIDLGKIMNEIGPAVQIILNTTSSIEPPELGR